MIIVISLILLAVFTRCAGKLAEILKLPALIGMMLFGMVVGPYFLNLVPEATLNLSPLLRDTALVTVLFIGGLGISMTQLKKIGRPAFLLSVIPAVLEGFAIAFGAMILLDFSFVQGAILGFIIAAVSPAILIPSMVNLIQRKMGQDKAIPQMLLVGASADDTVAVTLFTTFLAIYLQGDSGESTSILIEIFLIPITLLISLASSFLIFKISKPMINLANSSLLKTIIAFGICLIMRTVERDLNIELFNSLLAILVYGFLIRNYLGDTFQSILALMNKLWELGKLYLFAFVGMLINPAVVGSYFLIGVALVTFSLTFRSIGVLISLIGTDLTFKERVFCIIAYLPKATIQAAKASIPLQMGVAGGEIIEAIAILSVLITAPIGAMGIKLTSTRFLHTENEEDVSESNG